MFFIDTQFLVFKYKISSFSHFKISRMPIFKLWFGNVLPVHTQISRFSREESAVSSSVYKLTVDRVEPALERPQDAALLEEQHL